MGLIEPNEGEIKVDNISISQNVMKSWRDQIGYVAQDTFLFNETIKFNLLLSQPKAHDRRYYKSFETCIRIRFCI